MSSVSYLHKLACDLAFRCTSAALLTGHAMCFMTRNLEGSACTCNPSVLVEPSAHTRTHNRSSEAPAQSIPIRTGRNHNCMEI